MVISGKEVYKIKEQKEISILLCTNVLEEILLFQISLRISKINNKVNKLIERNMQVVWSSSPKKECIMTSLFY